MSGKVDMFACLCAFVKLSNLMSCTKWIHGEFASNFAGRIGNCEVLTPRCMISGASSGFMTKMKSFGAHAFRVELGGMV